MDERRAVVGIFCDDVRNEIGNKFTLVGCYGPDMLLASFPAVLPKLGILARAITPADHPFQKLTLRLWLNSDLLGEVDVPLSEATKASEKPTDTKWLSVQAVMLASPVLLQGPGEFRLEADTEEGAVRGSKLRARLMDD
jgi:hypothetical protein